MNSTDVLLPIASRSPTVNFPAAAETSPSAVTLDPETFRRLVEEAEDIVSLWQIDGVLTYLSPAFKRHFGYEIEAWLGKAFDKLVHPDDLSACLAANQQVAATGENKSGVVFRIQHQAGHWIWMSVNIIPIKDDQAKVVAFHGILRNIDQTKRQETALRFIVEGTAAKAGDDFFQTCVEQLAEICQVDYAFITSLVDDTYTTTKMLALWTGKETVAPYEFDLAGTPCQIVFQEGWGIFPQALQARFPQASSLATLSAKSYVGTVIKDPDGNILGNLGIIDTKPLSGDLATPKFILQLFAARVGSEMKRTRAEAALREQAERQTLLNQLAYQIRHSLELETVIATAIQSIQSFLEIDYCAFGWYDPDATAMGWTLIQEAIMEGTPSALGSYPATLVGPIDEYLLSQKTLRIDEVEQYSEPIHRAFLERINTKSEILIPIRTHADKIGVIICGHHREVRPWSDSEVVLLEAVGTQLAIAIDQAERYAESQETSQFLQQTLKSLKQTQSQMVQNEKMSSLGQLVAGIAHEINNPINFIHGNIIPASEGVQYLLSLIALYQQEYPDPTSPIVEKIEEIDLEFLNQDLPKLLTSLRVGTERIREIIKSLRLFSRLDECEVKPVSIHDGLESTLMILQHRLKATSERAEIKIVKDFAEMPLVDCFAGQLNQVFMNVLVNAIDVLEERDSSQERLRTATEQKQPPSTIYITTALIENQQVEIKIKDSGPGMPESIRQQIFDPFFTTKAIGQGTGLGLAISYQIVTEKHGGQLLCHSSPGQGTEFCVQIPIRQAKNT